MNPDIRFYLSVFLRRLHYFILITAVFAAAGFATAVLLPEQYRADALLLWEPPQIPDSLAASTVEVTAEEQVTVLQQQLLTRSNLIDIAREFRVFADHGRMFPDEIVAAMREGTSFRSGGRSDSRIEISFTATNPQITAAVVNEYIDRLLQRNIELRTGVARNTMDFFEQQRDRLAESLREKEAAIAEYKGAHINSLPESLAYQTSRVDDLRDRSTDIAREIAGLGQQRERLVLVAQSGGTGSEDLRSPRERELDGLRSELANALTLYSAQNPRVKMLQARITSLESTLEPPSGVADTEGASPALSVRSILDLQLDEIDKRVEALEEERAEIGPEIERLEANIAEIPANGIRLDQLEREYENLKTQYNQVVARAFAAETGERIELMSKGGRFTLIDPPVVPREPVSPNRPAIAAAGLGLGVAAGLGFIVLLELMNRSIRRPVDLVNRLGITPLATLPLMRTPRETIRRRVIVIGGIIAAISIIVGGITALHVYYLPLDLLIDRALGKLGL